MSGDSPPPSAPPLPKSISFDEIVQGRDASVRITVDGLIYAIDLVMVVTGKGRDHSGKTLRDLPEEVFPSEKFYERNVGGKGMYNTKVLKFEDAIELVMVLPGKIARETRTKFANIIKRYMAGDEGMVKELRANAQSTSPIAQLARDSPVVENNELVDDEEAQFQLTRKRKMQELELEELTLNVREKRINIDGKEMEVHLLGAEVYERLAEASMKFANASMIFVEASEKNLNCMNTGATIYKMTCPNQVLDERGVTAVQDGVIQAMSTNKTLADSIEEKMKCLDKEIKKLTVQNQEEEEEENENKLINISDVAGKMNLKFDRNILMKIGIKAKKEYMKKYGKAPEKHDQFVNGMWLKVCSYEAKDKDIVVDAIKEFM
jgi:GTPase SAR1 family protein